MLLSVLEINSGKAMKTEEDHSILVEKVRENNKELRNDRTLKTTECLTIKA